jgi:hypothetical protein
LRAARAGTWKEWSASSRPWRCTGAQPCDQRPKQLQVREVVAGSLQEEHRDLHVEEVAAAFVGGTPGWVQRESQKDDALDSGQRRFGLRL